MDLGFQDGIERGVAGARDKQAVPVPTDSWWLRRPGESDADYHVRFYERSRAETPRMSAHKVFGGPISSITHGPSDPALLMRWKQRNQRAREI